MAGIVENCAIASGSLRSTCDRSVLFFAIVERRPALEQLKEGLCRRFLDAVR